MLDQLGGRKFIFGVVLVIAGIIAEMLGKSGLSDSLVALLLGIYATFAGTNVLATSVAARAAEPPASVPEAPVSIDTQLAADLSEIKTGMTTSLACHNDELTSLKYVVNFIKANSKP